MTTLPPELKHLATIEARALELVDVEPAVSYWARYWIVQKSIASQKNERSSNVEEYLMSVLEQLETMKAKHAGTPEIEKMEVGKQKVETFALQIFDNADREEKAKRATKVTVNKFLAAATFLEVCQVFGTPAKDLVDKRKYAKVQAMRIQTAFAAGKDPNAGKAKAEDISEVKPTAEESAELDALLQTTGPSLDDAENQILPPKSPLQMSPMRSPEPTSTIEPFATMQSPPAPVTSPGSNVPGDFGSLAGSTSAAAGYFDEVTAEPAQSAVMTPSVAIDNRLQSLPSVQSVKNTEKMTAEIDADAIADAQKHAKWAISALNYDDIGTAVMELRKALATLGAQ